MKKLWLAILSLLLLGAPMAAGATVTEAGETYILGGQEVVQGNLYAAGGTVQLAGTVEGDAAVAGGNVTVNGMVTDDLMVAGGTVLILGDVGEDVRAAGGNVTIISKVGGELVAAAGLLNVTSDSIVAGDAFLSGGTVVVEGIIDGDVEIYGEEVKIAATINGSVTGKMTKLTVVDGAQIGGNLAYESAHEAEIAPGALISGSIEFEELNLSQAQRPDFEGGWRNAKRMFAGAFAALALLKYLATLIAGLVLVALLGRKSDEITEAVLESFGHNLLLGLAVVIVAPITLLILLFTGLGMVLSMLGFALLWLLMILGGIFAGISLGGWIRQLWTKSKHVSGDWKSALLGITLLSLAMVIPVVGWLFRCVFVLAAVGALIRMKYERLQKQR